MTAINPGLVTAVKRLFLRFGVIYGRKWQANVPPDDPAVLRLALAEWAAALDGIAPRRIDRGIAHARRTCEWPPSIAEFLRLSLALPSLEDVMIYDLADLGPVGAHIRAHMDRWHYDRLPSRDGRAYLRSFYPRAIEYAIADAKADYQASLAGCAASARIAHHVGDET